MALPPVAAGDPHAAAHNSERDLINDIQDVTDPAFKAALDAEISAVAPVESVNGQIGEVVLDAGDVGAATPADVTAASTADRNRVNHIGVQTSTTISDLLEAVQDIIGSSIAAGSNMTMDYNDATGIITLSAIVDGAAINTDPEVVRDTMGNALVGAGLITVTVNDVGDTITISTGATANSSDVSLRDRSTHTGNQPLSTITGVGGAAALNVGSTAGTVAAGDHNHDSRYEPQARPFNSVAASYTLVLADAAKVVYWTAAAPGVITIPTDAAVPFPQGTYIEIISSSGQDVQIVGDVGVGVYSAGGSWLRDQYGVIGLRKVAPTAWILMGRTST